MLTFIKVFDIDTSKFSFVNVEKIYSIRELPDGTTEIKGAENTIIRVIENIENIEEKLLKENIVKFI